MIALLKKLQSPRWWIPALALWLAATAGVRPLMLPDEGRYAGIAWEMASAGNWALPLLDGMPFFHKPPLFYWIDAFAITLFGGHPWAARLASVIGAVAAVAALFLFLRRYASPRLATMASLVLVTQPFFFVGAQFANLDMLVAGMISATILAGADALLRHERGETWRAAAALTFALAALGVLAKGLIGIVLPGGVLLLWVLWRRRWRSLPLLVWPVGIIVFAAIALPWFFLMQRTYPGFFDYFVVYHHFQRFSQTGFNNQMPLWFYVPVIALLALPWTLWLFRLFRRSYWRSEAQAPLRSLMAIWLLLILVFFSLPSSKLVGYILPVLPPVAFFVAEPFLQWCERAAVRGRRWFGITLATAAVTCVALVVGVRLADKVSARPLAEIVRPAFAAEDQLVMVDRYQYDLPFYLHTIRPAWVLSDWDDPTIPERDNWRKELFDAGQFDGVTSARVLLTPARFAARMCEEHTGSLWVWGTGDAPALLPVLSGLAPYAAEGKYVVWRLTPEALSQLPACAGRPRGG